MLSAVSQLPLVPILLLGGMVACLFGYRLFRLVLGVTGFVAGAMVAGSFAGTEGTLWTALAVVGGGLAGAGLLIAAFLVSVALVGAALGAVTAPLVLAARTEEPTVLMIVIFCTVGAVAAMFLERYVLIVGTAFGGAWAMVVAAMTVFGHPDAVDAVASGRLWQALPVDAALALDGPSVAWLGLGVAGLVAQLGWTAGNRGRGGRRRRKVKEVS